MKIRTIINIRFNEEGKKEQVDRSVMQITASDLDRGVDQAVAIIHEIYANEKLAEKYEATFEMYPEVERGTTFATTWNRAEGGDPEIEQL